MPHRLTEVLTPRGVEVGTPTGPDWATCAWLSGPEGMTRALDRVREAHGASPEIAGSYLANWYAAGVVGPAIASFVLLRRVPDLTPAAMSLRALDSGWFDRTAFHRGTFTMLADDPIEPRDQPPVGPRVVPDLAALRGVLVEAILGHLEPFIQELRGRIRLGYPALWGAVAGQCARAFLLTERATDDPRTGPAEADAFFAVAAPITRVRPRWHEFVHRGRQYTGMRCGSCCLAHRLGEDYCTSCPFTTDHEREARLRAWIDTQGHGGLAV